MRKRKKLIYLKVLPGERDRQGERQREKDKERVIEKRKRGDIDILKEIEKERDK